MPISPEQEKILEEEKKRLQKEKEKEKILEEADYIYDEFRHKVHYNKKTKKVFFYEAVRVHDEDWLRKRIKEENVEEWGFYFDKAPPSEAEKEKLISELL